VSDERVWLRNAEHGGTFHCPADAVEHWRAMGWEPCDAPEEHNPVTAELVAAQRAAEQDRARAEQEAADAAEANDTDTTPQES
jgi:hypothetical protein